MHNTTVLLFSPLNLKYVVKRTYDTDNLFIGTARSLPQHNRRGASAFKQYILRSYKSAGAYLPYIFTGKQSFHRYGFKRSYSRRVRSLSVYSCSIRARYSSACCIIRSFSPAGILSSNTYTIPIRGFERSLSWCRI